MFCIVVMFGLLTYEPPEGYGIDPRKKVRVKMRFKLRVLFCMKAVTILQALVLQKPSRTSKIKDHIKHLKRRMDLWKEGDILNEGRCIQRHLYSGQVKVRVVTQLNLLLRNFRS